VIKINIKIDLNRDRKNVQKQKGEKKSSMRSEQKLE
jgi:hypothetical protein